MAESGHTILFCVSGDLRVDRLNIAKLKSVVRKSTTPVAVEIYYHAPQKLSDFAEAEDRIRYVRLRSGENFPVAERMQRSPTDALVVLSGNLLLSVADLWQLLPMASRHALTTTNPHRTHKNRNENLIAWLYRDAVSQLDTYLHPIGHFSGAAFALNRPLLLSALGVTRERFSEKISYTELLSSLTQLKPQIIQGDSIELRPSKPTRWLNSAIILWKSLRYWQHEKKFPWWFTPRAFVFPVAQLAAYTGALVALVSPVSGLMLLGFAMVITPQFFFTRLSYRRPLLTLGKLCSRTLLYFVG